MQKNRKKTQKKNQESSAEKYERFMRSKLSPGFGNNSINYDAGFLRGKFPKKIGAFGVNRGAQAEIHADTKEEVIKLINIAFGKKKSEMGDCLKGIRKYLFLPEKPTHQAIRCSVDGLVGSIIPTIESEFMVTLNNEVEDFCWRNGFIWPDLMNAYDSKSGVGIYVMRAGYKGYDTYDPSLPDFGIKQGSVPELEEEKRSKITFSNRISTTSATMIDRIDLGRVLNTVLTNARKAKQPFMVLTKLRFSAKYTYGVLYKYVQILTARKSPGGPITKKLAFGSTTPEPRFLWVLSLIYDPDNNLCLRHPPSLAVKNPYKIAVSKGIGTSLKKIDEYIDDAINEAGGKDMLHNSPQYKAMVEIGSVMKSIFSSGLMQGGKIDKMYQKSLTDIVLSLIDPMRLFLNSSSRVANNLQLLTVARNNLLRHEKVFRKVIVDAMGNSKSTELTVSWLEDIIKNCYTEHSSKKMYECVYEVDGNIYDRHRFSIKNIKDSTLVARIRDSLSQKSTEEENIASVGYVLIKFLKDPNTKGLLDIAKEGGPKVVKKFFVESAEVVAKACVEVGNAMDGNEGDILRLSQKFCQTLNFGGDLGGSSTSMKNEIENLIEEFGKLEIVNGLGKGKIPNVTGLDELQYLAHGECNEAQAKEGALMTAHHGLHGDCNIAQMDHCDDDMFLREMDNFLEEAGNPIPFEKARSGATIEEAYIDPELVGELVKPNYKVIGTRASYVCPAPPDVEPGASNQDIAIRSLMVIGEPIPVVLVEKYSKMEGLTEYGKNLLRDIKASDVVDYVDLDQKEVFKNFLENADDEFNGMLKGDIPVRVQKCGPGAIDKFDPRKRGPDDSDDGIDLTYCQRVFDSDPTLPDGNLDKNPLFGTKVEKATAGKVVPPPIRSMKKRPKIELAALYGLGKRAEKLEESDDRMLGSPSKRLVTSKGNRRVTSDGKLAVKKTVKEEKLTRLREQREEEFMAMKNAALQKKIDDLKTHAEKAKAVLKEKIKSNNGKKTVPKSFTMGSSAGKFFSDFRSLCWY